MEILLRDISLSDVTGILRAHIDCSSIPYLLDDAVKDRAAGFVRKTGVWDSLNDLDPHQEIYHLKRSAYREYQRTGDREAYQDPLFKMRIELRRAAAALWLDHPKADLDYLQDLLWAFSEQWTWVPPAHEYCTVDLFSSELGLDFAVILKVFSDWLEDEVKETMEERIQFRIILPYLSEEGRNQWRTARMNWNHVCNGNVLQTALLFYGNQPEKCAPIVHQTVQDMTYALDGFTDDGGCEEGASYWQYGFGHFIKAAYALYLKTDGEINIAAHDPKIERICRYPLAVWIDRNYYPSFADCHSRWLSWEIALLINKFFDIPELYHLCDPEWSIKKRFHSLDSLALYEGQKAEGEPDRKDYFLPDLGEVKMRSNQDRGLTVCLKAGHNGVPHNHNDIGSFVVYKNGEFILTDPGAPVYTKKTFSSDRYSILVCNSHGHSVPVINGELQSTGAEFKGTLSVDGLNGDGEKSGTVDMSGAYSPGTVNALKRTVKLLKTGDVIIEDSFEFDRKPETLSEQFMTMESAEPGKDGDCVLISGTDAAMKLICSEPGVFSVEELSQEQTELRDSGKLKRITFVPETLAKEMTLQFRLSGDMDG